MKSEYFIVLICCIIVPLMKSFSREINFYRNPASLVISIALPFFIFILWDIYATSRGHWDFNPDYITGYRIYNLPIEEVLFFIVIPFCGLFTWEVVKYFYKKSS
ncbi:MAG: lycopene cyclase domain-containing protein [Ignavibacteria bacterium]|nr:lycopene cyclase domain-containing protein [Ignavibacteria bacterium]